MEAIYTREEFEQRIAACDDSESLIAIADLFAEEWKYYSLNDCYGLREAIHDKLDQFINKIHLNAVHPKRY